MRARFIVLIAAALFGGFAFAQNDWVCPDEFAGQTLSVYNWATYIADDTIANFEAACDVRVNYDTYASDDDMLVRLRQGNPGFDVVVPSDVVVAVMIAEGLLEELNHDNLPNFANLDPTFLDLPYDPENRYTVPYQWGTVGIGYNVERVGEVESWTDLFEYDGPVAWLEDTTAMLGMALLMNGFDPNSADPKEMRQAVQYLIDNGSNVLYIGRDDGQELLLRGEVDMVIEYSGDIFQIMEDCECDSYDYVIPSEGTNFWVDSLVIPRGAPNHALAEQFLDYVLSPQVAADIANYTAYGTPNLVALEQGLIDPDYATDPGIYPSAETRKELFFATQIGPREAMLNDAWDEIKIFIGR